MGKTIILYEDWVKKGKELFGKDINTWQFECPHCKTAQSWSDFLEAGVSEEEAGTLIAFSCIGRIASGKGCDWSLGGLFKLHETEVKFPDGDIRPVFEFAAGA